jgi:hypothetical protein
VSEQIAAFVTGGLDASETERVETHLRECAICDAAMKDALAIDRRLESLFASAKPGPAFEDRAIRALRVEKAQRAPKSLRPGWKRKLAWCTAASVGLGLTGAGMSLLAKDGKLPFPGMLSQLPSYSTAGVIPDEPLGRAVVSTEQTWKKQTELSDWTDIAKQRSHRDRSSAMDPEAMARNLGEKLTAMTGMDVDRSISVITAGKDERSGVLAADGSIRALHDGTSNSVAYALPQYQLMPSRSNQGQANGGMGGPGMPGGGFGPGGPGRGPLAGYSPPVPGSPATSPPVSGPSQTPPGTSSAGGNGTAFDPARYKQIVTTTGGDRQKDNNDLDKKKEAADPDSKRKSEPNREDDSKSGKGNAVEAPVSPRRLVIRSGEIEFEIESFDSATATVIKLVNAIKGGYVGTVNSDKLANGKVKGSIVVRVPPEALDGLVLDLRRELGKGGELKGQRIASQDITKQYTDIESRLKAARTMEERLLKIIKEGKGEIKQLLEAEKELGVWRTKIEEMEGEIRYYNNQVSLSTLTITLAEKEIKAASALAENERIQTGIEVEDVEKAHQDLLAAVAEAKGRITKSELKQLSAGQFNATLNFECAQDKAGPLRDRLKQLGHTARLEIDRVQQTNDGRPLKDAKVTRGDTQFFVQIYNLANMATRETATMTVATQDVAGAYRGLRDAITAAKGRITKANLDERDRQNITGQIEFEARRADEAAIQTALSAAGETISRNVARAPEADNVTDAKVAYRLTLVSASRLNPRETYTLGVEVRDVDQTVAVFASQVAEVKGEVVTADVGHERNGRVTARLIYNVPLTAAASLAEKFKGSGIVRYQQIARDPQAHEGKFALARLDVTLSNQELIVAQDESLWTPIRKGLSWSVSVLLLSLSWVIVGLCVVLPWGLVGYGLYRLGRRLFYTPPPAPVPVAPAPPAPTA